MKNNILLLALSLLLVQCKQEKKEVIPHKKLAKKEKIQSIDTLHIGDLNHDKIADSIFVTNPMYVGEEDVLEHGCINNLCDATIRFSCKLPDIPLKNAIGASIESMGDINNDGFEELIIVHQWFVGCWGKMYFYTYKNTKWKQFGDADSHLCDDDSLVSNVKKINNHTIEATEKYFTEDGDIGKRTKRITIN
jgi:hypothetical protein